MLSTCGMFSITANSFISRQKLNNTPKTNKMKEKIIEILNEVINEAESAEFYYGWTGEYADKILELFKPTTEEKPTYLWDKVEKINAKKRQQTDNENTDESKGVGPFNEKILESGFIVGNSFYKANFKKPTAEESKGVDEIMRRFVNLKPEEIEEWYNTQYQITARWLKIDKIFEFLLIRYDYDKAIAESITKDKTE